MQPDDEESSRRYAEREICGIGIIAYVAGPGMLLDVEIMEGLQLHPQSPVEGVLADRRGFSEDGNEGNGVNAWIRMALAEARKAVAKDLRALARSEPIADFKLDAFSLKRRLSADTGKGWHRHERAKVFDERTAIGWLWFAGQFCVCHGHRLRPGGPALRRRHLPKPRWVPLQRVGGDAVAPVEGSRLSANGELLRMGG